MINVYDIILNWTDQNKVYDFFEWEQNDDLEHIKKIPLYKVDYQFMHDIWYHTVKINSKFLENILRKTEVFFNKKIEKIEYSCLFSDGYKVVAVEFASDGTSIYKSSLLLDEEEEILETIATLDEMNMDYQVLKKEQKQAYFTRRELKMKNYLSKEFKYSYKMKNAEKLQYMYHEIFDDSPTDLATMYQALCDSMLEELTENHINLYHMVKLMHSKRGVHKTT